MLSPAAIKHNHMCVLIGDMLPFLEFPQASPIDFSDTLGSVYGNDN